MMEACQVVSTLQPAAAERRRHVRCSVELAVSYTSASNFYVGLAENLSEGGVFVATESILPIGSRVTLQLTLPEHDSPISVEGEVRWVRTLEATTHRYGNFDADEEHPIVPGMGIQFDEIDSFLAGRIREFIGRRDPEFFEA